MKGMPDPTHSSEYLLTLEAVRTGRGGGANIEMLKYENSSS